MVYCGKPSKGCSNCRERKVRVSFYLIPFPLWDATPRSPPAPRHQHMADTWQPQGWGPYFRIERLN